MAIDLRCDEGFGWKDDLIGNSGGCGGRHPAAALRKRGEPGEVYYGLMGHPTRYSYCSRTGVVV